MKSEKIKRFFSSRAAKGAVMIAAVLLVGLAVYLNYRWFYDPVEAVGYGDGNMSAGDSAGASGGESDYFTAAALSRAEARDEAIDILKLISDNEEASAEARADAAEQISRIAIDIQNEANIEAIVKAKGFNDCVAIISDGNVSVIVSAESLAASQTAQIVSAVYETTGITPDKVTIINK